MDKGKILNIGRQYAEKRISDKKIEYRGRNYELLGSFCIRINLKW